MRIHHVAVAVLVILAGCSGVLGGGGGDEPVETFTPMSVPTDKPTPTPVPQLAPGLTGEGIENVNALAAAHTSFLNNTSFTKTTNSTALASNGTVLIHYTSTLRAGPDGERVYSISKRNSSYEHQYSDYFPIRTEAWSNDKRSFVKRTYANGTTRYYRYGQERYGVGGAGLRFRLEPFGTANTAVVDRFTRNGTTLYRVDGITQSSGYGNVSLRLLVDSRGVIHSYRTVRWRPPEANVSQIVYKTKYSEIGATNVPERPSWVDEAMNQTTPIQQTETTRDDE